MNISISVDTASPALAAAAKNFSVREPLYAAMGHRVIRDTSAHVRNWGLSHPNKLGGRRTNYWSIIADKINPADCLAVGESGATMTLDGGVMPGIMRAVGDVTIVPGTKTPGVKYIPIPARSEAYGLKPREIPGLIPFFGRRGVAGLAEAVDVERKRDGKKGKKGTMRKVPGLVMYWFTDSVTQPQDRTLLPSEEEWSQSATAGAKEWVDLQIHKSQGGRP